MRANWMLYAKKADFNRLSEKYKIDPVMIRIMRNRDVLEEDMDLYLNGTLKDLPDPGLLKDMDLAADMIQKHISENKKIRIVGDYDIDGVCSTYILLCGLRKIGANVDYEIPDRIKDGYGINDRIIEDAAKDQVDLIITCDNGISAISQIRLAKELGMRVIVTDHHELQVEDGMQILPCADAVINPKQKECKYPYKEICGGLVAFKLIQYLFIRCKVTDDSLMKLLEFAAIATVGDVMKLKDENRIIVKEGLKRIKNTSNKGLRYLIEKNEIKFDSISAYHIGFVIGPCINAGGRLESAKIALKLFLCEDDERAKSLADDLKQLNEQRKDMTEHGLKEAIMQVDSFYKDDTVLVVYLSDCHESLAGIIAGRLREKYHKPAIVLTDAEGVSGMAKGSGRSIEAYHMFQALNEVKDLLEKFGGHPMAAGLSLRKEAIEEFRRALNEKSVLTQEDLTEKVWIDVAMPLEYVSDKLIEELQYLEPFGQGNEKPLFAQRQMLIRDYRIFGKNRNVIKLSLETENGFRVSGVLFGDGDEFVKKLDGHNRIDIIYYPEIDTYNGKHDLQAVIRHFRI